MTVSVAVDSTINDNEFDNMIVGEGIIITTSAAAAALLLLLFVC